MSIEPRISMKKALLAALLSAAAAFHAAAETFKAAATAAQAAADAQSAQSDADKKALQDQLDTANTQLDDAHAQLATAQQQLADFQSEEKLEDHPELVQQMSDLGVTDGEVTTPADQLPPDAGTTPPTDPNAGSTQS